MKRTKSLIKTAIIALVFMLSIAVSFAITGAWYLATRNANGTITLNDGIIIDYSGFDQGAGVWENNAEFSLFGNGSAMLPGASVNLNNAAIKANYSSADFFARVKLEYKFFTDLAGEYEVTNQISDYSAFINTPTFAQGWVDGRNGDGWFYYATGTTFNALPSADYVNIFTPNQSITLNGDAAGFDHQGGGYQYDEFTLIKRIEVVLTLSTYQADATAAANAGWEIVPAYTDAAGVVYTQNANETWTLTDGTALSNNSSSLTATYEARMYDSSYSYTVLSQINNQDVVAIGEEAFLNATQLTAVTIPTSVTTIGARAFEGTGLTSVTIPENVASVGANSLYANTLTEVTIENETSVVDGIALAGVPTTSVVNVPAALTSGYETALGGGYTIQAVVAPVILNAVASDNVSWGDYMATDEYGNIWYLQTISTEIAVRYCVLNETILENNTLIVPSKIIINESLFDVAYIGIDADADIGDTFIVKAGGYISEYINSITSINMPKSIKTIRRYAFANVHNLTSVFIFNLIENIGSSSYWNCTSLQTIYIDSSTIAALDSSNSYLLDNATTVYVLEGLTVGDYINNWGHTTTSDKTGYVKYVRNS